MGNIGVIVPVYQVVKYIDRSIQSILNQSYREFELILVDDGSTDGSSERCDFYALQDPRVHTLHLEHVGVSAVRNTGIKWMLEETNCQWIIFIDSDDWVHPQMLERLLKGALEHNVAISLCSYGETVDDTNPWGEEIGLPELWTPEELYLKHFITATIPVAKLCRRDCFEGREYPVGKIHEDEYITYQMLFEQKKVAVILDPLYAYYYNPQSITKRPWTPDRLDAWGAYEQQIAFFTAKGYPELVKFRYRGYLENAMVNLAEAENYHDQEAVKPVLRKIKKRIRQVIRRAWKCDSMDFRWDYELLERFYPLSTRVYRLWLETKEYFGGKDDA